VFLKFNTAIDLAHMMMPVNMSFNVVLSDNSFTVLMVRLFGVVGFCIVPFLQDALANDSLFFDWLFL